jgi:hypothetical protein
MEILNDLKQALQASNFADVCGVAVGLRRQ